MAGKAQEGWREGGPMVTHVQGVGQGAETGVLPLCSILVDQVGLAEWGNGRECCGPQSVEWVLP